MNAGSWFDTRLSGCNAHGGSRARSDGLDAHRQAAIRHILNPADLLRTRSVEPDALSAALLAERDLNGVDYAGGGGY
jgi:hypothetical protein